MAMVGYDQWMMAVVVKLCRVVVEWSIHEVEGKENVLRSNCFEVKLSAKLRESISKENVWDWWQQKRSIINECICRELEDAHIEDKREMGEANIILGCSNIFNGETTALFRIWYVVFKTKMEKNDMICMTLPVIKIWCVFNVYRYVYCCLP